MNRLIRENVKWIILIVLLVVVYWTWNNCSCSVKEGMTENNTPNDSSKEIKRDEKGMPLPGEDGLYDANVFEVYKEYVLDNPDIHQCRKANGSPIIFPLDVNFPPRAEDAYLYRQKFDYLLMPPYTMGKLNKNHPWYEEYSIFHKLSAPSRMIFNALVKAGSVQITNEQLKKDCEEKCVSVDGVCGNDCKQCHEDCKNNATVTGVFCAEYQPLMHIHSAILRFIYLINKHDYPCFETDPVLKKEIGLVREMYDMVKKGLDEIESVTHRGLRIMYGMVDDQGNPTPVRTDASGNYEPFPTWEETWNDYKNTKIEKRDSEGKQMVDLNTGALMYTEQSDYNVDMTMIGHLMDMIRAILKYYIKLMDANSHLSDVTKNWVKSYNIEFLDKVIPIVSMRCKGLTPDWDNIDILGYEK